MKKPQRGSGHASPGTAEAVLRHGRQRAAQWTWRLVSTASLLGWMGIIFYLSSSPPAELPKRLEAFSWLGKLRDIVGHLVLYQVLGNLLIAAFWAWLVGAVRHGRWALLAVGLGVLYGGLDEYHQSFVSGRAASVFDVMVDSAGVVAGVVLAQYLIGAVNRWRIRGVAPKAGE